jgi:hypothetical protein
VPSPVRKRRLVGGSDQSVEWDDFRAGFLIEPHDGGVGAVEVAEHAGAATKADALPLPKLALTTAFRTFLHLVWLPPHLGRGIRPADPFGRTYGTGTVTVVSGVVTATVVPRGTVAVTVATGVDAVTVAAAGIDSVGTETAGTRSVEEGCDGAEVVLPAAAGVDGSPGDGLAREPSVVLR